MEKRAPPPVPTHRRPEMTARDEIWSGESVRKAWPGERNGAVYSRLFASIQVKLNFHSSEANIIKTSALNDTTSENL